MKNFYIFTFTFILLSIGGCNKDNLTWNLKRDNPLDSVNQNNSNKKAILKYSRYEIAQEINSSGVSNGIINKGEYIYLLVYVKNIGDARAESVKGTITTSSSYITMTVYQNQSILESPVNYDYISPSKEGVVKPFNPSTPEYSISFQVSNSTPNNTTVTFKIDMTDKQNNQWTDSFDIQVYD